MKPRFSSYVIAALLLAVFLSAIGIGYRLAGAKQVLSPARIFQVQGTIRDINPAEKTVRVAHQEIPGFMPAMTMSLPVRDVTLLRNLASGDEVQFELQVTREDSWISHIEKIESAMALNDLGADRRRDQLGAECLNAGELVPDFTLTDQDGRPIHLSDFRGKAVVMTFIYTRCPLPNFCPLLSKNFAQLEQRLSSELPNKYHLLSISMDPEYDRPKVLKEYAARYASDPKDWTFATGEAESIHFVAELMGLYFEKENGLISHDLRTVLISPDGHLVHVWKSNVWTPYEIQRRLREVLTGDADVAFR